MGRRNLDEGECEEPGRMNPLCFGSFENDSEIWQGRLPPKSTGMRGRFNLLEPWEGSLDHLSYCQLLQVAFCITAWGGKMG